MGYQVILGRWLSALATLLLGPIVSLKLLLGFTEAKENPWLYVGASLVGLLGISAVVSEHRTFDLISPKRERRL